MATAAAIDRVVHHSVILEFDVPSYRTSEARELHLNETDDNYQQVTCPQSLYQSLC